jgi:hypothetical protein
LRQKKKTTNKTTKRTNFFQFFSSLHHVKRASQSNAAFSASLLRVTEGRIARIPPRPLFVCFTIKKTKRKTNTQNNTLCFALTNTREASSKVVHFKFDRSNLVQDLIEFSCLQFRENKATQAKY